METILEALKTMGKATAREVAARMKIDAPEALTMLREHEENNQVSQVNGYWALTGRAPTQPATKNTGKVNEAMLTDLLHQHGPQTTEQLAKRVGATVRAVASTLAMPVHRGRIVRDKAGGVFYYTLPESNAKTTAPEVVEPVQPVKPAVQEPVPQTAPASAAEPEGESVAGQGTAEFMDTIPQLAAGKSSLAPLTPNFIAGEIRKTKNRLVQLEKLRVTVRIQTRLQRSLGL